MSGLGHRLRVARARTQARIGFLRLAVAIARGQVDEVWVGDSHAVLLATARWPFHGLGRVDERRWVWHLGPRLMFSIARDGLPPGMVPMLGLLRRVPRTDRVRWLVSFGEIDVRCHLAPRLADGADLDFVDTYVDRIRSLVGVLGSGDVLLVVPPPPAVDTLDHQAFPVVGSPDERLAAHRAVRERLLAATTRGAPAALDLTADLSEASGLLAAGLTDDGCHTNDAGRDVVRRVLDARPARD